MYKVYNDYRSFFGRLAFQVIGLVNNSSSYGAPFSGILEYFRRLMSGAYDPWVVLIELFFIGVVVYTTLRFLQGTRGARLMRGIGVVLVCSFILVHIMAEKFQWERVEFLYEYFLLAVFLITLVVFQPELRRGFMRIGEQFWFARMFKKPDKTIAPIVQAVSLLAKKRIGALIAIERFSGLAAIVETGITLEAALSSELLNTIFWPGSALHDMGVVVKQDQVVAAGCQFPLAESGELDRSLGSRHRAAVGLSQESDAVVVVVSEETGIVSVAHRGQLERSLSSQELRNRMYELLTSRKFDEKPLMDSGAGQSESTGR